MKGRSGLSLLELLLGAALLAIAGVVANSLWLQSVRFLRSSRDSVDTKSALAQLSGSLQKYMATGDMRFLAYSGNGSATPPDRAIARFFIPMPGRCADLSTAACAQDVSLLFIHYDKSTSPAVTAICALDATHWLVDLANQTYGPAQFIGTGFRLPPSANPATQGYASGDIPMSVGQSLAILNPPSATLWLSTRVPEQVTIMHIGANYFYRIPGFPDTLLPAACLSMLQPAAGWIPYNVASLYRVSIRPLVLTPFTGGNTVTAAEVNASLGNFPMRVIPAEPRVVGRQRQGQRMDLVQKVCSFSTGALSCTGNEFLRVPGVDRLRISLGFHVPPSGSPIPFFELLGPGQTQAAQCIAPVCAVMPITNPARIRVLLGGTETIPTLSAAAYSLLKNEALATLRLRALMNTKEEITDVLFP